MTRHLGRKLSPDLDVLQSRSFAELAAVLRSQAGEVLSQWAALVREMLPTADHLTFVQLRDHVPDILGRLADALEATSPLQSFQLLEMTPEHGAARFDQGFKFDEVVIEYRLLRRVIIERADAALGRRLTAAEDVALNMAVDAALQNGLVAYVGHLTARLRAAAETEVKYLAFLSHDLRGTLNSVTLKLELLRSYLTDLPDGGEYADMLDSLKRSIFTTTAGMDRLLQVERLRKEADAAPKIGPVDLHALATDVVRTFAEEAGVKGVRLSVDLPPGAVLDTDREWVTLVLRNLVGNAVKYSRGGTVRVRYDDVRHPKDGSGHEHRVVVSDQGPGIAPDQLGLIFEAFKRGDTRGEPGVGLGLAIASQAARLLGGEVRVTSRLGVGSEFCLAIPRPEQRA